MNQIKKPRVRRLNLKSHKINKIEVVALVSLVVLVGAAVVYKSFAGSNAKYVPKGVTNLKGYGRAVRINPTATGGYAMDGHGQLFAFAVGTTTGRAPYTLPTSYYSSADTARDFEVLNWTNPSVLILSKDGQLHVVGNSRDVQVEAVATNTARKLIMYDAQRGYILDGSGRFIRFALDGVSLPPAAGGFTIRTGQDFYRSATLNPNKKNGYVAGADGNVYEFRVGTNAIAPAISAGTTWSGADKAVDITLTNWAARQGYVIASDGGWYAFNGAPNDYNKKSGAPFNFGTNVRGFYQVAGKAGFEINKDGTIYVFSLPNYLVAQNDKEIYPPAAAKPFVIGPDLGYGYHRMPVAPNGEYDFYNPKIAPYNTQPTPAEYAAGPNQRCGRPELLNLTYAISKQWQAAYGKDGSRINVGDLNAAGHISHSNGVDVDIRTSNLSAANLLNAQKYPYLRERSIDLAKWLIDGGAKLILYNDSAIYGAVNAYGRSKGLNYDVMQYYASHNEHMHVRIGAKTVANNPLALRTVDNCPK